MLLYTSQSDLSIEPRQTEEKDHNRALSNCSEYKSIQDICQCLRLETGEGPRPSGAVHGRLFREVVARLPPFLLSIAVGVPDSRVVVCGRMYRKRSEQWDFEHFVLRHVVREAYNDVSAHASPKPGLNTYRSSVTCCH